MTKDLRLETARLILRPFTPEFIEALESDRDRAAMLIGAQIPADWSDAELAQLLL